MIWKSIFIFSLFVSLLAFPIACKRVKHSKIEIETAMKHYDRLIQKMDADSISLCYTYDGSLGHAAQGRDSIRNFLEGFKNVKVLSQNSTTDTVELFSDSSIQKGAYTQVVSIMPHDTVKVKGLYTATWVWNKKEGWLLKSMNTTPVK